MIRLLVLLAAIAGAAGCLLHVESPLGIGGRGPLEEEVIEGSGRPKVLLLEVTGVITDEPSKRAFGLVEEESTLGAVHAALAKAEEDSRVRAVVLRIDSPGGGVTASDEIYSEIVRFKRERGIPVVASLGDLAASGGYYVACGADRIVAHPTTVAGSIGVILANVDLAGLLAKLGIRDQTYKAGAHKDLLSPLRPPTPEERRIVQDVLDALHARFITVVRENRPHLATARLPELTDGRIFDAAQALEAGLVDEVGDLHQAIADARRAAGLEHARLVRYHRPDGERHDLYARGGAPVEVSLLPARLFADAAAGPRFLYLWAPGLVD
ncbi:MAG TPA: signal peptide peptidase SppA [Candidatus Binatia bacterium]|nr:signal peptide peptidase SppA [Candidatus Binatia bacterium]